MNTSPGKRLRSLQVMGLALVMALLLAGCGSSSDAEPTATSAPTEEPAIVAPTEPSTPVATPAPTEEDAATAVASPAASATPAASPVSDFQTEASPVATPGVSGATPAATAVVDSEAPEASPIASYGTVVTNLGCWSEPPLMAAGYPQWSEAPSMKIDTAKHYTATIVTNRGTIVADLFADKAPNTVNNFICLATNGYYDGVIFHRVINDFMIQTGDPTGTGRGGPGYQFADELPGDDLNYVRGVLAMANAGPNTNGSQFFINQGDNSSRLGKDYTIFGKVIEGMDVVDTIAGVPVSDNGQGEQSLPAATITILSITIEEQ